MRIINHLSAKDFNSFNIDVGIDSLIEIESKEDLHYLSTIKNSGFRILGGGSNILLTKDISEPVVLIRNKGIEQLFEGDAYTMVSIAAGENWHDVVLWATENNLGGIENLSLIPGNSGTAPMQNIGAYGVEIKDVLHSLRAFCIENQREYTFHSQECKFGYRDSIFKNTWKGKFIITEIILQLTKDGFHNINTSYGQISTLLESRKISSPGIKDVRDAVIDIRKSKLPDPEVLGNAGSFFKNPIITNTRFIQLQEKYPDIPSYPAKENFVKIPAAWLIDQCGWKGKRVGQTGTFKNQALVIVNHGDATGKEIYNLSKDIQKSVSDRFSIDLEREVNVW